MLMLKSLKKYCENKQLKHIFCCCDLIEIWEFILHMNIVSGLSENQK